MQSNRRKRTLPLNSNKNLSNKSMTKQLKKLLRLSKMMHNPRTTPKWLNNLRSRRNKLRLPLRMKMMKKFMSHNRMFSVQFRRMCRNQLRILKRWKTLPLNKIPMMKKRNQNRLRSNKTIKYSNKISKNMKSNRMVNNNMWLKKSRLSKIKKKRVKPNKQFIKISNKLNKSLLKRKVMMTKKMNMFRREKIKTMKSKTRKSKYRKQKMKRSKVRKKPKRLMKLSSKSGRSKLMKNSFQTRSNKSQKIQLLISIIILMMMRKKRVNIFQTLHPTLPMLTPLRMANQKNSRSKSNSRIKNPSSKPFSIQLREFHHRLATKRVPRRKKHHPDRALRTM